MFFHTGPSDPVSTSVLKAMDQRNETLPCKVIGISMDTTHALFSWMDSNPELENNNVPLMSDRDASISRGFGVLQKSFTSGQIGLASLPTPSS